MMSPQSESEHRLSTTPHADIVEAAKNTVAIYRHPAIGWLRMRGGDRLDFLQRLTTNELASLRPGNGKYTVVLTEKARVIDVVGVCHAEQDTMLLCSAGNAGRVRSWLRNYVIMDDVQFADCSADVVAVEWIGPHAPQAIMAVLDIDVATLPRCGWVDHTVHDQPCRTIRVTAMCELAYMTLLPASLASVLDNVGLPMLDDATYGYLRVMQGMGALGAEWTEAYNPLEAGLLHMVSFSKGCYIGQEVVARLDTYNKVKQRIVGIVSQAAVAPGDAVSIDDVEVGRLTSVVRGIHTPVFYALGYVRHEHALADTAVTVHTTDGEQPARIVDLPMQES
jgi:folate-binding protein YgfZ